MEAGSETVRMPACIFTCIVRVVLTIVANRLNPLTKGGTKATTQRQFLVADSKRIRVPHQYDNLAKWLEISSKHLIENLPGYELYESILDRETASGGETPSHADPEQDVDICNHGHVRIFSVRLIAIIMPQLARHLP
jgi:hypothetical protein